MSDDSNFVFDPGRMFRAMQAYGHNGALGLRFRDCGPDWCQLVLPWRADLVGDAEQQTMANGPIITLMDMTSGMALWTRIKHFRPTATLDLRIDYLRAARPRADMFSHVECYRVAREVAFVRGVAHDGDVADPVANMAGVFMFIGGPAAPRGSPENPVGGNPEISR
jgi:acyl-coenzyme A thioesterase PaaI-like protein